ncbi:kinase-like domain-containing protein [Baffinella frigidus]|nr:kinase-like domain-containing protein [Cryptophyta sp. CCMP2293]
MKKRPGFKAMVINSEDDSGAGEVMKSSLSVTAGGSLQVRDFHLNKLGMCSGITLDDLTMDKELGRGASSVVYMATHKTTGTKVACKMLTNVHDKELRKQLVAEMQFLKPLLRENPCPFLIQVFDAYFDDDKTYIVLEFCDNGALDVCLAKHGPVPEPALSVITRMVFLGLSYLYRQSIVHRDMKPANCLIDAQGVCKISDFGSSKKLGDEGLKSPGVGESDFAETFTGTTRYMSPERLKGERYSWPADVWCAGMIMLELAFGDHPYKVYFGEEDGSFMAMLDYATKRETPQLPADKYSEAAIDFANLCLAKDAASRPPPVKMVNEEDPECSHNFIVNHMALGNEQVLQWLATPPK